MVRIAAGALVPFLLVGCVKQPEIAAIVPFTVTGLARADDGSWWVGNHGKLKETDPDFHPSLVHLASDFTPLADIKLPIHGSVQGVAVDRQTLWYADLAGKAIRQISWTGEPLGSIELPYKPNGIAIDGREIWVNDFDSDQVEKRRLSDGAVTLRVSIPLGTMRDHLTVAGNQLLYSHGPNRQNGHVNIYDKRLQLVRSLELKADAIEGIVVVGNTLYVANDGGYHHGEGGRNRILKFRLN